MILDTIAEKKRVEIAMARKAVPVGTLLEQAENMPGAADFHAALKKPVASGYRIIAEVKKASPSKGVLRKDFDPVAIARGYERGGAAAVSVLTDEAFFMGSPEYLRMIKQSISLPVFRKDFILDEYQIHETRAWGGDAMLLIAALLDGRTLEGFLGIVSRAGMQALVEVHTGEELDMATGSGATIIGINNRDLNTFETDIGTTFSLLERVPSGVTVVSESGITTQDDMYALSRAGVDAFLIGEALMRAGSPGEKLAQLAGAVRENGQQ